MSYSKKKDWTHTKDLLKASLKRLGVPTDKVEEVTIRQKITAILNKNGIEGADIIMTNPSRVLIKTNSPYSAQRARENITAIKKAVGKEKAVRVVG